jgi:hypothetical protein
MRLHGQATLHDMRRRPMGRDWKIPKNFVATSRASIIGVLDAQPVCRSIPGPERNIAVGTVRVNGDAFSIVGSGELAKQLATIPGGSVIQLDGGLRNRCWKVGSGQERARCEIEIEAVKVIGRCEVKQ